MKTIKSSHTTAWTHEFSDPVHWAQAQVQNYFKYGHMRAPRFGQAFVKPTRTTTATFLRAREHDRAKWNSNPEGYSVYLNEDVYRYLT